MYPTYHLLNQNINDIHTNKNDIQLTKYMPYLWSKLQAAPVHESKERERELDFLKNNRVTDVII